MPRLISLIPTEEQEHLALMDWVATKPKIAQIFVHHANERKCHPWQGAKFKRLGVKAGFPDFHLPLPRSPYHGLFLELKRRDGRSHPTASQKWWLDYLNSVGYIAKVAYGASEAIEYIKDYLKDSDYLPAV